MNIEVNYKELSKFDGNFSSLSKKMDRISDKVKSLSNSLDWEIASQENIKLDLKKAATNIDNQAASLTNMSKFITIASKKYKSMDKATEKLVPRDKVSFMSTALKKVVNAFKKVAIGIVNFEIEIIKMEWKFIGEFLSKNYIETSAVVWSFIKGGFNNKFMQVVQGKFDFPKLKKFFPSLNAFEQKLDNVGQGLTKAYDKSKLKSWVESPGKLGYLKKTTGKIATELLKTKQFVRGLVSPVITNGIEIIGNSIDTLKDKTLSGYEKTRELIVNGFYDIVEAGVFTFISYAAGVAGVAALGLVGAPAIIATVAIGGTTGWLLDKGSKKMKLKERVTSKLDKEYDNLIKLNKVSSLEKISTPVRLAKQSANRAVEVLKGAEHVITTKVKPAVEKMATHFNSNLETGQATVLQTISNAQLGLNTAINNMSSAVNAKYTFGQNAVTSQIVNIKANLIKKQTSTYCHVLLN